MKHFGYIYKYTLNEKIYVGKRQKPEFDEHYWGSGIKWKNALKKYGKENVIREVVVWCDSLEELNEAEIYWIAKLDACNDEIGYNISPGGDGATLKGEANGMYKKKHTLESRKLMSQHHPKNMTSLLEKKYLRALRAI